MQVRVVTTPGMGRPRKGRAKAFREKAMPVEMWSATGVTMVGAAWIVRSGAPLSATI
jgi:hypothetical protein